MDTSDEVGDSGGNDNSAASSAHQRLHAALRSAGKDVRALRKSIRIKLKENSFREEESLGGHSMMSPGVRAHNTQDAVRVPRQITPEIPCPVDEPDSSHEPRRSTRPKKSKIHSGSGFVEITHTMISEVSQSDPALMGWSDDGLSFFFCIANKAKLSDAIKPYFSHGNFHSFRRQLSAYRFNRMPSGRSHSFWWHHEFHREMGVGSFERIQKNRRRRSEEMRSVDTAKKSILRSASTRIPGNSQALPSSPVCEGVRSFAGQNSPSELSVKWHSLFPTEILVNDAVIVKDASSSSVPLGDVAAAPAGNKTFLNEPAAKVSASTKVLVPTPIKSMHMLHSIRESFVEMNTISSPVHCEHDEFSIVAGRVGSSPAQQPTMRQLSRVFEDEASTDDSFANTLGSSEQGVSAFQRFGSRSWMEYCSQSSEESSDNSLDVSLETGQIKGSET